MTERTIRMDESHLLGPWQTAEMAWKYPGAEERMAQLAKLMAQTQALAQTPEQEQRVALFRLSTWEYMGAGRPQHGERLPERTKHQD